MAKNFFEQILSLVSNPSPEPDIQQNYSRDPSGLSGVARYLEKKNDEAAKKEVKLTGVARYLEEHATKSAERSAGLSGVDKYLAKQAAKSVIERSANKTKVSGVAKYLAKQAVLSRKASLAAEAKASATDIDASQENLDVSEQGTSEIKTSKVEAYLEKKDSSKKKTVKESKAPAKKVKPKPEADDKKSKKKSKAVKKDISHSSGILDLSANVTQCQASTGKGKRCSRKTSLIQIKRTINKQKYKFTVCSQHDIDSFKPYPPVIENN